MLYIGLTYAVSLSNINLKQPVDRFVQSDKALDIADQYLEMSANDGSSDARNPVTPALPCRLRPPGMPSYSQIMLGSSTDTFDFAYTTGSCVHGFPPLVRPLCTPPPTLRSILEDGVNEPETLATFGTHYTLTEEDYNPSPIKSLRSKEYVDACTTPLPRADSDEIMFFNDRPLPPRTSNHRQHRSQCDFGTGLRLLTPIAEAGQDEETRHLLSSKPITSITSVAITEEAAEFGTPDVSVVVSMRPTSPTCPKHDDEPFKF